MPITEIVFQDHYPKMKDDILKLLKDSMLTPEEEKFYANILTEQMIKITSYII